MNSNNINKRWEVVKVEEENKNKWYILVTKDMKENKNYNSKKITKEKK